MPLPDNAVLITFDDGRADALMFADPLLEQAGMQATMFLISSATDRPNLYYAGWDRIEQAARSGRWDIQAHTHDSHRDADTAGERLPLLTSLQPGESLTEYRARIRKDLDRNAEAIEDHLGQRPAAFAYPFGAYGADRTNDPRIRDVLREEVSARYLVAFHQDEQESVPLLDPAQDRMNLRRLEVGDWSGADLLARIRHAAGSGSAQPGGTPAEVPPSPSEADLVELTAPTPTTSPRGRARRNPARPNTATGTAFTPTPTTTESTTTTTFGPATTTTSTEPSTTTTTSAPPSTTTTQPPTTTTTEPRSTTTTRPSGTTTTTEKPCRGKGHKECGR